MCPVGVRPVTLADRNNTMHIRHTARNQPAKRIYIATSTVGGGQERVRVARRRHSRTCHPHRLGSDASPTARSGVRRGSTSVAPCEQRFAHQHGPKSVTGC